MTLPAPQETETMGAYLSRCIAEHGLAPSDADQVQQAAARYAAARRAPDAPAGYERRSFAGSLELRAAADDGHNTIVGHAAVFGADSLNLGGFIERIAPKAFRQTLRDADDVRALWNHDPNQVLGRTTSGTLRLHTDDRGLAFEVDPPATTWARDHLETLRRGDVTQASFGFIARKDEWQESDDGEPPVRTLLDVQLLDVSPVTYAAYPATDTGVAQRSLTTWRRSHNNARPGDATRNREQWIRQRLSEQG